MTTMLLLLLARLAHAGSVAVVDFDAVGATEPQAILATDAVRDAMFVEAGMDALTGSDIAERLAARDPEALGNARTRLAAGRAKLAAGLPGDAVALLQEAVELHEAALSPVARRGEAADARWALAIALLRLGRTDEASTTLGELARLWPGYATTRAADKPTNAVAMLKAAEEQARTAPRRTWPTGLLRDIEVGSQSDVLVTGLLLGDGTVLAQVWDDGMLVGEASATVAFPPSSSDEGWATLVRELVASMNGPRPTPMADTSPEAPAPEETFEEPRTSTDATELDSAPKELDEADLEGLDLDAEPPSPREAREPKPAREARPAKAPKVKTRSGSGPRAADRPRIRGAGGSPARAPVTSTWWFWTILATLAGGGMAATAVALQEPAPVVTTLPDAWTLSITTGVSPNR